MIAKKIAEMQLIQPDVDVGVCTHSHVQTQARSHMRAHTPTHTNTTLYTVHATRPHPASLMPQNCVCGPWVAEKEEGCNGIVNGHYCSVDRSVEVMYDSECYVAAPSSNRPGHGRSILAQ